MARIRLKFVNGYSNKNRPDGRVRYYFRRRGTKAIPLPGIPGSEEFMAAYGVALASTSNAPSESRTLPGTVGALGANYYKSDAWLNLPPDTRKNRKPIIDRWCEKHHNLRVPGLRRHHFEKMLSEITAGAGTKSYWLYAIRDLLESGVPNVIKENPTAGIKVKRLRTKGHHTWTDAEIAQYRAHWPLGTEARLVLEFAYQTASRRGEVVRLGRQHLYQGENGEWRIKIARIKGSNDVDIPMTDELLAACQAMPKKHLTYITSESGKPISKKTLGARFAKWATEAGLPKHCRMHGLKKSILSRMARRGATAPEFMAVSGHKDMAVAQDYIEEAFEGPELANNAFEKLRTKRDGAYTNTPQQLHKRPSKPLKKQSA